MHGKVATPDQVIARIAAGQYGVVALKQLLAAGISYDAIEWRLRTARLHRLFRGVYAVGQPAVGNRGMWRAATLALVGAVLSHFSAAMLWRILPADDRHPQVTVPGSGGHRRRKGIVIHRSLTLAGSCSTVKDRIPVTTVARTISDLRRTAPPEDVRKAIRQAEFLGLNLEEIETDGTRSPLERLFLQLCRKCGLPEPEVNALIGIHHVDFLWREQRLAVETDGWAAHRGRQAFEDDHARGLELMRRGIEMLPLTELQLKTKPALVAAILRERLNRRGPSLSGLRGK